MADETLAEETEEEERRDGDILGDVKESGSRKRRSSTHEDIPYERQWELDPGALNFSAVSKACIPDHILNQRGTRIHSFDSVHKCTQIGLMTFFSVTIIKPVGLSCFGALSMLIVQCSNFRLLGWYHQNMESPFKSFDGPVNRWHTR